MVVPARTWEAEAGRWGVQGQPGLLGDFASNNGNNNKKMSIILLVVIMIRIIINSHTVRKEFSNTGGLVPRDGLSSVGNAIKRHSGNNGMCIVFLRPICLTFQWSSQSQSMFCLLFSFIHSH